jgi:hypothetical protein
VLGIQVAEGGAEVFGPVVFDEFAAICSHPTAYQSAILGASWTRDEGAPPQSPF